MRFKTEISVNQRSQRHDQADTQPGPRGSGAAAAVQMQRTGSCSGEVGRCGGGDTLQPEVVLHGGVAIGTVRDANRLCQSLMTRESHLSITEESPCQPASDVSQRQENTEEVLGSTLSLFTVKL